MSEKRDPLAEAVRLGIVSPRIERDLRALMAERGEPAWVLLSEGDPPSSAGAQAAIDWLRAAEEEAATAPR